MTLGSRLLIGIALVCLSFQVSASIISDALKSLRVPVSEATLEVSRVQDPAPVMPEANISEDKRGKLIAAIDDFQGATRESADIYRGVFLFLTVGSILVGLAASIAAFCKRTTLAGVLSIVAAGIVGTSNVLPIAQSADIYRQLSAQSRALHLRADQTSPMTRAEHAGMQEALAALILAEGKASLSSSSTQDALQGVLTAMMKVSSPT